MPAVALAEILDYPKDIVGTPEKIESLFNNVADWFFTIFLIVAVMAIIYTAFIYLTSTGDPTKIKRARTSLTFAIVAIAIAILASGMPKLIQNLLENGVSGGDGASETSDTAPPPTPIGPTLPPSRAAFCGDGMCNADETCSTCTADCGSCSPPPSPSLSDRIDEFLSRFDLDYLFEDTSDVGDDFIP